MELLESRRLLTSITEYAVPLANGSNASPAEITAGPNGTLWFIGSGGNEIGSLSTASPNPEPYPGSLPAGSLPLGITLGPDGNLIWFTEFAANQIGMINPNDTSHTIQYFGTSDGMTARSGAVGITSADGYLWFTQNRTDQIGRLDPSTGKITEYSAPAAIGSLNSTIVLGPDGNLWFTEFGAIGIFNPNTGTIVKELPLLSGSKEEPFGIAVGPDGNIWYTEGVLNSTDTGYVSFGVGTINTNTETLIPEIPVTASSEPFGITAGPDGNMWFTVTGTNMVAGTIDFINPSTREITLAPKIPTNEVPTPPNPVAITAAPDGNIWFADGSGAIGVVADTHLVATAQPPPDVSVNSPFELAVTDYYTSGVKDKAFNSYVTIALGNNPGGSTSALGGTVTVLAVNGVATFSVLTLNNAGNGYTLQATSNATNGPTAVTTSGFNVVAGPAERLVVTTQPPDTVTAGSGFAVAVKDEYVLSGPVDTAFNGNVTIALGTNPGGSSSSLGGTVTVPAVNGVATFSGLTLNNAGNGYTLRISGGVPTPATTNPFDVTSVVPPPPPPPPMITGEQVVFNQKRNKKGKPIGKPTLAGYTIDFSTAMNQGTVGNPVNYQVEMFVIKRVKKKKIAVPKSIGFTVSSITSNSVTLKLAGKQTFPKGGQITVIASPPNGVDDTSGVFLSTNGVFTISRGGKAITLVS
ncbi:MAG: DUF6923 family protein [Isosphaerales bacterium]